MQRKHLFQIFRIYWIDSLFNMQEFWDLRMQWSNCPYFVAKKDLHWIYLVEKGKSGYSCQDAKFRSTPSQRTLLTCTPARACRNSQSSCPVQSHGTMRDGGIWKAHHRAGELPFKICLKDVTEDLYSPQEAKPCCPSPEIMSKGTNLMWLSKLPASTS